MTYILFSFGFEQFSQFSRGVVFLGVFWVLVGGEVGGKG